MSRSSSKFNLGNLRKQQDSPYFLFMDDLRSEHLGINIPDLLNLLDGNFVITEQKYKQETTGQLKKNLAITLNQTLEHENRPYQDTNALKARIVQITLYGIKHDVFNNENLVQKLQQQAIAFSILTKHDFFEI